MIYLIVYFNIYSTRFSEMAKTLVKSIEANDPRAGIEVIALQARKNVYGSKKAAYSNAIKLKEWASFVQKTDKHICLIDADCLVMDEISEVWEHDFDIGFTKRYVGHRIPFNSGVVFVKNTVQAKAFMQKWSEINIKMYYDKIFHEKWMRKYFGYNQASFGWMMENYDKAKLKSFPTFIYNACDPADWHASAPRAKIVHYKSELRKALFNQTGEFPDLTKKWHGYNQRNEGSFCEVGFEG